jgi:hypothetical protein
VAKWIINGVIALVSLVWAASMIADMVNKDYDPPPAINVVMMAVLGALFGKQVLGKAYADERRRDDGKPG